MSNRSLPACALLALSVTALPAGAADPAFQAYFLQVCATATGALATRCSETPAGLGDLSGDSESSLKPSQNLSHTKSSVGLAEVRSTEARERAAGVREGEDSTTGAAEAAAQLGPFSLLIHGRVTSLEKDRDPAVHSERGLDGDGWALEIGLDRRVSDRVFVGALAAFENVSYDFDPDLVTGTFVPADRAGSADTDSKSLTLYAVWNVSERSFIDTSLGYGRQQHDFRRNPVAQGAPRLSQFQGLVTGDTDSRVWWAAVNAGLDFGSGATTFGPFAGLTYTNSRIDSYTERDLNSSGLHMALGECRKTSVLGHLGLRADRAFSTSRGVFVPQLRVEYLHEFRDHALTINSQYVLDSGPAVFTTTGDKPDQGRVSIGAGVNAILPNGWIAFVNADTLVSGDLDRHRFTLGLRKEL
jgi:outer membrane autotransporter protein